MSSGDSQVICESQGDIAPEPDVEPFSPIHTLSAPVCSLRSCRQPLEGKSRVRIKALPCTPTPDANALVEWDSAGYAEFHRECWELFGLNPFGGILPRFRMKCSKKELEILKVAASTAEHFDAPCVFSTKARKAAELIISAKHCVIFTGAGISTSAGIQDWRGPDGVWSNMKFETVKEDPDGPCVDYNLFRPTFTHEAIAQLLELGYVKHVISQNVDGLHLLSGIPRENLSELHGNAFVEYCRKCGYKVARSRYVPLADLVRCGKTHNTNTKCPHCKSYMEDTIVYFCDNIDNEMLVPAYKNAKECDVMVCLGSSFMVEPARSLVTLGKHKVVICNRQYTKLDPIAQKTDTCTRGDCDNFMKIVMETILGKEKYDEWVRGIEKKKPLYDKLREPGAQETVLCEPTKKKIKI